MRRVTFVVAFSVIATAAVAAPLSRQQALHRELVSGSPFMPTVRSSAANIANLAGQATRWFPAGTGPDVANTGAKPEIWQNQADFIAKLRTFQAAARAMNA